VANTVRAQIHIHLFSEEGVDIHIVKEVYQMERKNRRGKRKRGGRSLSPNTTYLYAPLLYEGVHSFLIDQK